MVSMPTHLLKWQVVRKVVGGCDVDGGDNLQDDDIVSVLDKTKH